MLVFAGSCDEDSGREREFISALRARRVDGIIVVPAGPDHSYLLPELRVGTAIVFVDRPPRFLDADSVTADDHGGTFMAVSHLVERGHERIAYLGADPAIATAEERLRGYRDALAAHGLAFDSAIVRLGLRSVEDAERGAAHPRRRPQADGVALGPELLHGRGLQGAPCTRPSRAGRPRRVRRLPARGDARSTGDRGRTRSCRGSVAMPRFLFRRLDGDGSPSAHIVCPVHLVPRGSGEIRPASA